MSNEADDFKAADYKTLESLPHPQTNDEFHKVIYAFDDLGKLGE
jgi:hypothetical protein